MKIKIIKQEKNPFLQREELVVEISSEATPNSSEVISALGKDETLTIIKKINTNFGRQKFLTEVVVYDSLEAREKIETIPQKVRKKLEAEKKTAKEETKKKAAEEAEAAKTAVEATEEKTEETKEEVKSE
ncbi:hypothetical protein KAT36_00430 [Candidatus Pacearchaeota archaeon]|nr:hypothetical protein [Candidatus Pacearchaeota archaeon]